MVNRQGLVIHITSGVSSDWRMALRNISNLYEDQSVALGADAMHIVVNGDAARFLLANGPESERLEQMAAAGVRISACENSLKRLGHSPEALHERVDLVQSGVSEVVKLQKRGETYLKLP